MNELLEACFIYDQCVKEMNRRGFYNWNTAYPSANLIEEDIKNGNLYLFRQKYVSVGVMCLDPNQPVEYSELKWSFSPPVLVVHRLAVHPLFRNLGIAGEMMQFALAEAQRRGCRSVRLDAISSNPQAQRIYQKSGFQKTGKIYFSYQKTPFICMEKAIDPV
jgi:ribosomal protein S18 acetylase RimI-like enzyme